MDIVDGVVPDEEDVKCSICIEGEVWDNNEIIFCDRCNVAVHQRCYDVAAVPEGAWCVLEQPSHCTLDCAIAPMCLASCNV